MNVGYIRVSTNTQHTERQLSKISLDKVFSEKISAKSNSRPKLQECLTFLREGDTLHVHSIDRLARNLIELKKIINDLLAKKVKIKFHTESLEFGNKNNPMSELLLNIMASFAEFERRLILERQREGIEAAKKRGKHLGRPKKVTKALSKEILLDYSQGISISELTNKYNLCKASIYKILKEACYTLP